MRNGSLMVERSERSLSSRDISTQRKSISKWEDCRIRCIFAEKYAVCPIKLKLSEVCQSRPEMSFPWKWNRDRSVASGKGPSRKSGYMRDFGQCMSSCEKTSVGVLSYLVKQRQL